MSARVPGAARSTAIAGSSVAPNAASLRVAPRWSAAWRAEHSRRLERAAQAPLTVLAVVLAPVALAPWELAVSPRALALLLFAGWAIWAVFALALAAQMVLCPDRAAYLRRHWSDALLVALPIVQPLVHDPRTFAVWLGVAAGTRGLLGFRHSVRRSSAGYLVVAAGLVVGIAADLVLEAERGNPDSSIRSYGDALWWTFTTVTSVGYGDRYPQTAVGRTIGIGLMVLGIALFGLVTARLASFFVENEETQLERQLQGMDARLRAIEDVLGKQSTRQRSLADRAMRVARRTRIRRRKDHAAATGRALPAADAPASARRRDRNDRSDRHAARDARRAARAPADDAHPASPAAADPGAARAPTPSP